MGALGCLIAALANWVVLGQTKCRAGDQFRDPFKGYSTSFILATVTIFFVLVAFCLSLVGMLALRKIPQLVTEESTKQDPVVYDEREYPVTYDGVDMGFASEPAAPYPMMVASTPAY